MKGEQDEIQIINYLPESDIQSNQVSAVPSVTSRLNLTKVLMSKSTEIKKLVRPMRIVSNKFLNDDQLEAMNGIIPTEWSDESIKKALVIKNTGGQEVLDIVRRFVIPLPAPDVVQKRLDQLNIKKHDEESWSVIDEAVRFPTNTKRLLKTPPETPFLTADELKNIKEESKELWANLDSAVDETETIEQLRAKNQELTKKLLDANEKILQCELMRGRKVRENDLNQLKLESQIDRLYQKITELKLRTVVKAPEVIAVTVPEPSPDIQSHKLLVSAQKVLNEQISKLRKQVQELTEKNKIIREKHKNFKDEVYAEQVRRYKMQKSSKIPAVKEKSYQDDDYEDIQDNDVTTPYIPKPSSTPSVRQVKLKLPADLKLLKRKAMSSDSGTRKTAPVVPKRYKVTVKPKLKSQPSSEDWELDE